MSVKFNVVVYYIMNRKVIFKPHYNKHHVIFKIMQTFKTNLLIMYFFFMILD